MIRWPGTVYVATAPVNLRASFDALAGLVRAQLRREPCADALFVFHNRRHTILKLYWIDGSGCYVLGKRLVRGTYRIPLAIPPDATHVTVSARELSVLLEGLDPAVLRAARRAAATESIEDSA